MAIGRAEDQDTPGNPTMLRHRVHVRDPIRAIHLGRRSLRPHTQAGHMTASAETHSRRQTLQTGGRPHMDSGLSAPPSPGMTKIDLPSISTRFSLLKIAAAHEDATATRGPDAAKIGKIFGAGRNAACGSKSIIRFTAIFCRQSRRRYRSS